MKAKLLTTAISGLMILNTSAVTVLTNDKVTVMGPDDVEKISAYRDHESCNVWYWLPSRYKTVGNIEHSVDQQLIKKNNDYLIGYASQLNFEIGPDIEFARYESNLKKKIAELVNSKIESGIAEEYKECKKTNANEIVLNPAVVKSVGGKKAEEEKPRRVQNRNRPFSNFQVTYPYATPNSHISPLAHFWATSYHDASSPKSKKEDNKWLNQRNGQLLGAISYDINGRELNVNSTYSVEGKYSAKFESEVKDLGCTVNGTESDNAAIGAAVGGLIAGPVGAVVGAGLFGSSETTTTVCSSKLITNMVEGKSSVFIKYDHSMSNFKNKIKNVCNDDGECHQFPLQEWVEYKMTEELIRYNLDAHAQEIRDGVFKVSFKTKDGATIFNGKQGDVLASNQFKVQIKQSTFDDINVTANIFKSDNQKVYLDQDIYAQSFFKCIQGKYNKQLRAYKERIGKGIMPIDETCLDIPWE
jgi:hypothetical protein